MQNMGNYRELAVKQHLKKSVKPVNWNKERMIHWKQTLILTKRGQPGNTIDVSDPYKQLEN